MAVRWRLHPALLLYGTCLLPRLALLFGMARITGEDAYLRYGERDLPFWDPFPVLFHDATAVLCGGNTLIQAVLYALVAAAAAPLVWSLAVSLGLGRRAGFLAGLAVCVYPYYVSTAWYQPEVGVTIAVCTAFVAAMAHLGVRPDRSRALLAAGATLLFLLERGDGLALAAFLGVLVAVAPRNRGRRRAVLAYGAWVAAGLVVLTAGNALIWGYASPLPRKSGYNLLLGHNELIGGYLRTDHTDNPEYAIREELFAAYGSVIDSAATDPRYCELFTRDAVRFARQHPGLTLRNAGYKFLRYWDWRLEDADLQSRAKNLLYAVPYLTALGLGLVGVVRLARRKRWYALCFLTGGILVAALPGLVSIPLIRVRMYSEFLLFVLAAAGISALPTLPSSFSSSPPSPPPRPDAASAPRPSARPT